MKKRVIRLLGAVVMVVVAGSAVAQSWPNRSVRLISPFAPGGGADITSRALAQKLTVALGQQVIVDNRGGAGGMLGVDLAAKSPPDGYTFVLGTIGPIAINPSLLSKMPYDPLKDLAPVSQAAVAVNVLVVHPSLPAKSVKELVAIAKARPTDLNYGSSGSGAADHLAGELFNAMVKVKMTHIPYKGGAPAMLDLVSGNVQLVFSTLSTATAAIDGGKVRPLAVAGSKRFEGMPDLPTMSEAGLKGFEVNNWYGLFAPAGTAKDIIARANAETVKALAAPDVKKRLMDAGIIATSSSPEAFSTYIRAETAKWGKVIKDANIKGD
ncbi:MAG: tripartite tricarboxylate transporter substrate binding protein [Burkholderiales bacterium]|jgi:tripartite-type tricarboxylate transporter receptor subunit TctC|nr:tripartite tricarboxylate transporter substrate binding protein [Burkholderiales bacterium]